MNSTVKLMGLEYINVHAKQQLWIRENPAIRIEKSLSLGLK
jgi:hypothetical protein